MNARNIFAITFCLVGVGYASYKSGVEAGKRKAYGKVTDDLRNLLSDVIFKVEKEEDEDEEEEA